MVTGIKDKVRVLYHLLKPEDQIEALISIIAVAIIANGSLALPNVERLFFALLFGFFLLAGTIILNQYFDINVDKINKPYRPLPSGKIKPKTALCISGICYVLSFVLSLYLGITYVAITVIAVLLSLLYSHPSSQVRKKSILTQVVIINAGYSIIAFIIGWCVYKPILLIPLWFLVFLFSTDIGGVFAKDYRDYKGDKRHGYATLPTVFGYKKAAVMNTLIYIVPFLVVILFALLGIISIKFVVLATYCILTGIYAFSLLLNKEDTEKATLCYYIITTNFMAVRVLSVWALAM